jgi:hypothetical protein
MDKHVQNLNLYKYVEKYITPKNEKSKNLSKYIMDKCIQSYFFR